MEAKRRSWAKPWISALPDAPLYAVLSHLDFTSVANLTAAYPEVQSLAINIPLPCWSDVRVTLQREGLVPFWHFLSRITKYVQSLELRTPSLTAKVSVDVQVKPMPHLTRIDLLGCGHFVTDTVLFRLTQAAPNVCHLRLAGCYQLTKRSMVAINRRWSQNLVSVDLSGCMGIREKTLEPGPKLEKFVVITPLKWVEIAVAARNFSRSLRLPPLLKSATVEQILHNSSKTIREVIVFSNDERYLDRTFSVPQVFRNLQHCSQLETLVVPLLPAPSLLQAQSIQSLKHLHIDLETLVGLTFEFQLATFLANASFQLRQLRIQADVEIGASNHHLMVGVPTALVERHTDIEVLSIPILSNLPDLSLLANLEKLTSFSLDVQCHSHEDLGQLEFLSNFTPERHANLKLLICQIDSQVYFDLVHFGDFLRKFLDVTTTLAFLRNRDFCRHQPDFGIAIGGSFCTPCRQAFVDYRSKCEHNCCIVQPNDIGPWPDFELW